MFFPLISQFRLFRSRRRASVPARRRKPFACTVGFLFMLGSTLLPGIQAFAQSPASSAASSATASLSDASVENLRAFAKLYGYVRYFHPSDEAAETNWDHLAIDGAERVVDASTSEDLQAILEDIFLPIAPTVQIYASGDSPPVPSAILLPSDTIGMDLIFWQHVGVGTGSQGPYRSLRPHRSIDASQPLPFGGISQFFDARRYRGMEIRLRTAGRAEVPGSGNVARAWLRVDREGGQIGFFSNLGDRPIRDADWQTVEIAGTVDEDAETIYVGGFLQGSGRAWFDDFEVAVREGPDEAWEPIRLLNNGFETGPEGDIPAGWNESPRPGYRITSTPNGAREGRLAVLVESDNSVQTSPPLFAARPAPGEVVNRPLDRGLSAQIPLALYSSEGRTLRPADARPFQRAPSDADRRRTEAMTATQPTLRYADIIITWNVMQHFYPYFDVVDVDWDGVLTEALERTASDRTPFEFLRTLQSMIVQLEDGHGRVVHPSQQAYRSLPILLDQVEGRVLITALEGDAMTGCARIGDIVESLDGMSAEQLLRDEEAYVSGSPQWKTRRALWEFVRGPRSTSVTLGLLRGDQRIECDLRRNSTGTTTESRPDPISEIRPDIYYLDLGRMEMDDFTAQVDVLAAASGVIIDMRGYPNGTQGILQHLTDTPLESAIWQVPEQIYPDRLVPPGYDGSTRWNLPPLQPRFTGRIAFLTGGGAISYAETIMGIVEAYDLGEIFGRTTAATNGNINMFDLPGEYRVIFTGMSVLKHDGSPHHLVGIHPTQPVERTIDGVMQGRDEDIEAAVEWIQAEDSAR